MSWKNIVGYEDDYEVSDCGQVRTKEGKTTINKLGTKRVWKQRVLKQKISKDNTCRVSLWINGREKTCLVHRLVAKAFISRIKGKNYINHKDGSRLNNNVTNLEWCDHTENNNHAFDNGLIKTGKSVVLVNKETKESHYFRSLSKASEHLGKSNGYLSGRLKGKYRNLEGYDVYKEIS